MHTFNGKKVNIHYNSDLSGDVLIFSKNPEETFEVWVDGQDLYDFISMIMKNKLISQIEDATFDQILKMWSGGSGNAAAC